MILTLLCFVHIFINFLQSMVVEPAPRLSMRRPNALLLRDGKTEMFLAFESKEERTLWMDTINQVCHPEHPIIGF